MRNTDLTGLLDAPRRTVSLSGNRQRQPAAPRPESRSARGRVRHEAARFADATQHDADRRDPPSTSSEWTMSSVGARGDRRFVRQRQRRFETVVPAGGELRGRCRMVDAAQCVEAVILRLATDASELGTPRNRASASATSPRVQSKLHVGGASSTDPEVGTAILSRGEPSLTDYCASVNSKWDSSGLAHSS